MSNLRDRLILLARRIDNLEPPEEVLNLKTPFGKEPKDAYSTGFHYGTLLAQEEIWKWVKREKKGRIK